MTTEVLSQRFTTDVKDPFVVFLVGMRMNNFWAFQKWGMVVRAAPAIFNHAIADPTTGCLGGESFYRLFPLTTCFVSYWCSFDDLERFARDRDSPHSAAWREFYQKVGYDGSVGVWHETYLCEPGKYEALYGNMPVFGLAKAAGNTVEVTRGHRINARGRMTGKQETLKPELEEVEEMAARG